MFKLKSIHPTSGRIANLSIYLSYIYVWRLAGLISVSLVPQPLYERCDRLKPTLFRLASDTVDDDEALTQILAANDELTLVLNAYKEQVLRRERDSGAEGSSGGEQTQPQGKDRRSSFTCTLCA